MQKTIKEELDELRSKMKDQNDVIIKVRKELRDLNNKLQHLMEGGEPND